LHGHLLGQNNIKIILWYTCNFDHERALFLKRVRVVVFNATSNNIF